MLARMEDILRPRDGSESMGILNPSDYQYVAQQLKQRGIIETIPEYETFYEPVFQTP